MHNEKSVQSLPHTYQLEAVWVTMHTTPAAMATH